MSKADKAPGADMEEILASIRRIIADGEAGASAGPGPDFSTRTAQPPELAPAEIHPSAYGADDPDDLANMIRGWETPRGDPPEGGILELSDEFVLVEEEGTAGAGRSASRALRPAETAPHAQAAASFRAPRTGRESAPPEVFRPSPTITPAPPYQEAGSLPEQSPYATSRHSSPAPATRTAGPSPINPGTGGARTAPAGAGAFAAAESSAGPTHGPRPQPRERQPVSFWSRREPFARPANAQQATAQAPVHNLEAARESAYARTPDSPLQGGEKVRERWFGDPQATPTEPGGAASLPEIHEAPQEESGVPENARERHKASDYKEAESAAVTAPAAAFLFPGHRPDPGSDSRPDLRAAAAAHPAEPHVSVAASPSGAPERPAAARLDGQHHSSPHDQSAEDQPEPEVQPAGPAGAASEPKVVGAPFVATGPADPAPPVFAKTPASARTDAIAETLEARPPAPQAVEPEVVTARSSTVIAPRQEARSYETHATQMTEAEIMPPTPTGGRSLEDTVKDMLRPMLRQWLNENMPRIVEKVAREEMLSRTDRDDDKE